MVITFCKLSIVTKYCQTTILSADFEEKGRILSPFQLTSRPYLGSCHVSEFTLAGPLRMMTGYYQNSCLTMRCILG